MLLFPIRSCLLGRLNIPYRSLRPFWVHRRTTLQPKLSPSRVRLLRKCRAKAARRGPMAAPPCGRPSTGPRPCSWRWPAMPSLPWPCPLIHHHRGTQPGRYELAPHLWVWSCMVVSLPLCLFVLPLSGGIGMLHSLFLLSLCSAPEHLLASSSYLGHAGSGGRPESGKARFALSTIQLVLTCCSPDGLSPRFSLTAQNCLILLNYLCGNEQLARGKLRCRPCTSSVI